jgi:dihydrofolate reductase
MGRKTFESIGRPLPGRKNIVISRDASYEAQGIEVVSTPELAIESSGDVSEVMIIGGGHVYDVFLPLCNRLYLTHIDLEVEGDTQFPDYESDRTWIKEQVEEHKSDSSNPYNYTFITYSN